MITEMLMGFGRTICTMGMGLMPVFDVQLPPELTQFTALLWSVNQWVPISELAGLGGVIAAYLVAMHGWKFVKWAIDSILAVIP